MGCALNLVKYLVVVIVSLSYGCVSAIADITNANPILLYGNHIDFVVYRNGSKVGYHHVKFSQEDKYLKVDISCEIKINFLFFNAFHFKYNSEARWAGGILEQLQVSVDDDGEKFSMKAVSRGQIVEVESLNGKYNVSRPLFPTNHWHASVLKQISVLNTLTGRMNNVTIVPQGSELISTEKGQIRAVRYKYNGDLENEVWYDAEGRWVKMQFKARDGSIIDYICRQCQGKNVGNLTP